MTAIQYLDASERSFLPLLANDQASGEPVSELFFDTFCDMEGRLARPEKPDLLSRGNVNRQLPDRQRTAIEMYCFSARVVRIDFPKNPIENR